jgi:hypothetical protein
MVRKFRRTRRKRGNGDSEYSEYSEQKAKLESDIKTYGNRINIYMDEYDKKFAELEATLRTPAEEEIKSRWERQQETYDGQMPPHSHPLDRSFYKTHIKSINEILNKSTAEQSQLKLDEYVKNKKPSAAKVDEWTENLKEAEGLLKSGRYYAYESKLSKGGGRKSHRRKKSTKKKRRRRKKRSRRRRK